VTSLNLSDQAAQTVQADTLVLAVAKGATGPVLVEATPLPRAVRSALAGSLAALGVTGAADEVTRLPAGPGLAVTTVTLTGVGAEVTARSGYPAEVLRRAAGAAARRLAGTSSAAFALPAADVTGLGAVAEGALFGAYAFTRHKGRTAADQKPALEAVTVLTALAGDKVGKATATRAVELGRSMALVRDLVNTAPGDLPPAAFADAVLEAASSASVQVTVLDEKALRRGGYGGILGVGLGSSRPPRLVKITYSPRGAKTHLALIGKGITFDSGGISLKPPAGMEAMKSDMAGGATVVGAVLALARLKAKVKVTAWVPLAENMPSGTAQRPSDVLTTYGGRTVEVLNTDAEGRLVLADAIVAASEEHPDVMIDIATLTGHQVVALGTRVAAIMGNDDDLRARVHAVADRVGDQMWPMPLPPELRAGMDSQVADIANMGERPGGMLVAGLFLKEFVGQRADGTGEIPWVHLDIAGPSYNEGSPFGYTHKGGTGHSLRTLVALGEDLAG
jgi:leucyl aminopeptidase